MRNFVPRALVLLLILLQVSSCKNGKRASSNSDDFFYEKIETSFSALKTEAVGDVHYSPPIELAQLTVVPGSGYLLASDRMSNSILLFKRGGTKLLSKIGRKGRGPGEFSTISQLCMGPENNLYVLDILQKRITQFKIEHDKLHYSTTIALKPKPRYSLYDVFVTKYGNFGVYHRMDDYKTWKESYHLFRLDKNFRPVEHLLDIPGNAIVKLADHLYIPGFLSQMTYWDLDGQWFYYIVSKSTKVHKYDIRTGKQETKQYFTFKERTNTPAKMDFFKHEDKAMIKRFPKAGDAIEKAKTIPFFDYFQVRNNRLLFGTFYPGGKGGRILYVNQSTGDVHYVKTPSNFWHFVLGKRLLYGIINMPDGGNKVQVLRLN